ncbi:MAG: formyltetrahydrofolate deformylase [Rhodocyclaceae bacterium]|jgi:formyltetrahydrofolate deformylase|nr:formyltetrahydrofolate deformylase [Rhodocyclaceae bacterium]MCZ7653586.1 formyltetrahydrofolate deformylase [Rhodocyclaceae bacterium]
MHAQRRYTLTASCPDRVGIVARVATFIAENQGWILETSHHADEDTQRYFMRIEMKADSLPFDLAEFRRRFQPIAAEFRMDWRIADSAVRKRLVLLVSKQEHCLYDLLARWQSKELDVDIPCVISNHETFRSFVEWHGIPFHHVPVTAQNKAAANAEIARLFEDARGDVMVLARYMQIIPAELCEKLPGRILNIHHSFLPSFVGAKPYHQAHQRGVKLIGATCHFVTAELDAGPIIEQDTVRIDHGDTVDDLVRYGKDIEKAVLARGLRYHVEDRVLLNGNRTVVFR